MISYTTWKNQRLRDQIVEQVPVPNPPTTVNGVQGQQPAPGNAAAGASAQNQQYAPIPTPDPQDIAQGRNIPPSMAHNRPRRPPYQAPPAPPAGVTGDEDVDDALQAANDEAQAQQGMPSQQANNGGVNPAPGSGAYFGKGPNGSQNTRFAPGLRPALGALQQQGQTL